MIYHFFQPPRQIVTPYKTSEDLEQVPLINPNSPSHLTTTNTSPYPLLTSSNSKPKECDEVDLSCKFIFFLPDYTMFPLKYVCTFVSTSLRQSHTSQIYRCRKINSLDLFSKHSSVSAYVHLFCYIILICSIVVCLICRRGV